MRLFVLNHLEDFFNSMTKIRDNIIQFFILLRLSSINNSLVQQSEIISFFLMKQEKKKISL